MNSAQPFSQTVGPVNGLIGDEEYEKDTQRRFWNQLKDQYLYNPDNYVLFTIVENAQVIHQ